MNNHSYFNDKKLRLIAEHLKSNKSAARGKKLIILSLYIIMIIKLFLALFEIPAFIILRAPINVLSFFFILPVAFVLYLISKGAKGFSYVILISAPLRLILYFLMIYESLPECTLTNMYTVLLSGALLLQFFISLFLLVSFDCDTYFSMVQRISIKIHGEELLTQKGQTKFSIDKND